MGPARQGRTCTYKHTFYHIRVSTLHICHCLPGPALGCRCPGKKHASGQRAGYEECTLDELDVFHPGGAVGLEQWVDLGGGLRSDVCCKVRPQLREDCTVHQEENLSLGHWACLPHLQSKEGRQGWQKAHSC